MVKEVRIRVAEAKQRDAGKGKARIDDEVMHALNIVAGDIISIKGKKTTAAVAWPAYHEDQDRKIIRMDGLMRKNAGMAINEFVTIEKVYAKEANSVVLAPVDMHLNVDKDFKNFVQSRLLEFPSRKRLHTCSDLRKRHSLHRCPFSTPRHRKNH